MGKPKSPVSGGLQSVTHCVGVLPVSDVTSVKGEMASAAEEAANVQEAFIFTRLIKKVLEIGKIQLLFFLMLILFFPPLVPFLREIDGVIQMRKANNPSYLWPDYQDLRITLYTAVFIYLLKGVLNRPLKALMLSSLQDKFQGKEREERAERSALNAFKGMYYLFAVILGYNVAKNANFFPTQLGGHGHIESMFDDFPYQPYDSFPYIRIYIMIELGYHLFSLVNHLASKPKSDFMEMLLHHCITLVLVAMAYFMNYVTISHLVLFSHDSSDLFVDTTRVLADSKWKKLLMVSGACLISMWLDMRIYIFPVYLIYHGYWFNKAEPEIYGRHLMGWMLHVLFILNVYWFILIVKMVLRYTIKRREVDIDHRFHTKKQN